VKLLLDTNVLVAALVARGTCSDLLEHCVRQHVVISSQPLLDELREVLERKFHQRAIDVRSALHAAIVTGDQDLLILDPFRGIRVLARSTFWKSEPTYNEQ
jgi:predicted nucleic acid-binding protein